MRPLSSVRSVPLVLLLAAGCNAEPSSADLVGDDEASIEVQILEATIGAEGGVLEGEAGGPFDGFRLDIPAGALTEDTLVTVTGAMDPTLLAADAQRVGPQFAILPDDLELAVPAEVTVPFDANLRNAWQNEDEDCRVWFRDGEGWSNAEQVASTPQGVTVPIDRFTVLAAGVRLPSLPLSCTLTNSCPPPIGASGCLDGNDYCLTRLAPPSVPAFEYTAISVHGGFAYYLTSPGFNAVAVAKYDLFSTTGTTTVTKALVATPSRSVSARGQIRPDPDSGDIWAALLGYGNVRFRFGSAATRFDSSTSLSPTGVAFSESLGSLIRFTIQPDGSARKLVGIKTSGFTYESVPLTISDTPATVLEVRRNSDPNVVRTELAYAASASGVNPAGATSRSFNDVCGTSSLLPATYDVHTGGYSVGCLDRRLATNRGRVSPGHAIGSTAAVGGDVYYVIDPGIAQLTRIENGSGITYLPLTDEPVGSATYNRMLPQAIRYDVNLDMLVLFTRGNNASGAPDIFLVDNLP